MSNTHSADGTGFKKDVHRLGEGVETLKADVNGLAHGAVDAARSGVAELRQGARLAVEAAKDKFEGAKETAADAATAVKGVIGRNPLISVGIAASVGLIVGMFICRRRS